MRLPEQNENLIGKIAVCSVGRVAIITGRGAITTTDGSIEVWQGIGFDGRGTWASSNPCIVAENGQEFHDRLWHRFGGRLTFNQ